MDDIKEKTSDLADHIQDLADTFYKLTVVNLTQRVSTVASSLLVTIVLGVLGIFIILFLGIALGFWLGDLMQSRTGGFLLTAAFFLLLLLIVASMRKKIIFPYIRNLIIRKMYD